MGHEAASSVIDVFYRFKSVSSVESRFVGSFKIRNRKAFGDLSCAIINVKWPNTFLLALAPQFILLTVAFAPSGISTKNILLHLEFSKEDKI